MFIALLHFHDRTSAAPSEWFFPSRTVNIEPYLRVFSWANLRAIQIILLRTTMMSPRKILKSLKKYKIGKAAPLEGTMENSHSNLSTRRWSGRLSYSSSSGGSSRGSPHSSCSSLQYEESHDDNGSTIDKLQMPLDVPEGCLAVYVGMERRRFIIHTEFLHSQVFRVLLKRSEEEFGYEHQGGLRISCEVDLFENLLWQLKSGREREESILLSPEAYWTDIMV